MVQTNQWIGNKITFLVSDPWDFCTQYGEGPFLGIIEDANVEALLVKVATVFVYEGLTFDSLVVKPRHLDSPLLDLGRSGVLLVNMIPVSSSTRLQDQVGKQYGYLPGSPFHMAASWRGWSLVGQLSMP